MSAGDEQITSCTGRETKATGRKKNESMNREETRGRGNERLGGHLVFVPHHAKPEVIFARHAGRVSAGRGMAAQRATIRTMQHDPMRIHPYSRSPLVCDRPMAHALLGLRSSETRDEKRARVRHNRAGLLRPRWALPPPAAVGAA